MPLNCTLREKTILVIPLSEVPIQYLNDFLYSVKELGIRVFSSITRSLFTYADKSNHQFYVVNSGALSPGVTSVQTSSSGSFLSGHLSYPVSAAFGMPSIQAIRSHIDQLAPDGLLPTTANTPGYAEYEYHLNWTNKPVNLKHSMLPTTKNVTLMESKFDIREMEPLNMLERFNSGVVKINTARTRLGLVAYDERLPHFNAIIRENETSHDAMRRVLEQGKTDGVLIDRAMASDFLYGTLPHLAQWADDFGLQICSDNLIGKFNFGKIGNETECVEDLVVVCLMPLSEHQPVYKWVNDIGFGFGKDEASAILDMQYRLVAYARLKLGVVRLSGGHAGFNIKKVTPAAIAALTSMILTFNATGEHPNIAYVDKIAYRIHTGFALMFDYHLVHLKYISMIDDQLPSETKLPSFWWRKHHRTKIQAHLIEVGIHHFHVSRSGTQDKRYGTFDECLALLRSHDNDTIDTILPLVTRKNFKLHIKRITMAVMCAAAAGFMRREMTKVEDRAPNDWMDVQHAVDDGFNFVKSKIVDFLKTEREPDAIRNAKFMLMRIETLFQTDVVGNRFVRFPSAGHVISHEEGVFGKQVFLD